MEHPFWKIGLFIQLDKEKAKCIECNIELKMAKRSNQALKVHLFSNKK